ncbi:MAG: tRNA (adenosine(37)-N6)-threonylcarbamoyltransferase complex transferase subunit TsaD [Ignavibacteriales bacterium]|nr:tRNA (adenosine(37)-N6)-threonylcarbamoyltransferase complex transferase subunit TsaD [Ignavibacteriales bacterium]
MNTLGIESSCDETSVAILTKDEIRANLISSQDFHVEYGGVVPELSSRAHIQIITKLVRDAIKKSKLKLDDINLICASAGPGLIGALMVGFNFGKALAYSRQIPFIPVDHIEGHIFSGFLMNDKPEFPFLSLVVSGGHTLLLIVKNDLEIIKLGSTQDDAAGEAFDKIAKMIGLGYPGGPRIQEYSKKGNPDRFKFPIARLKNKFDFSFSGLKTAVYRFLSQNYSDLQTLSQNELSDISASVQKSIVSALTEKVILATNEHNIKSISLVGGVASNLTLRKSLEEIACKYEKKIVIPDFKLCSDNAAMIAYRGYKLFTNGKTYPMEYSCYPSLRGEMFTKF